MGDSRSWAVISGKSGEAVKAELKLLNGLNKRDQILGGILANDSYVLMGQWHFIDEIKLDELSRGCAVIACRVEDHVMATDASEWRDGVRLWAVNHDSRFGMNHLQIEGSPPDGLGRIQATKVQLQIEAGGDDATVDHIYSIPMELVSSLTGFHYDSDEISFESLKFIKRKWWKFGRE